MEESKETWYERLLETPYETAEGTRIQLFETLEWQKNVSNLFMAFSESRKWKESIVDITKEWELENLLLTYAKTMDGKVDKEIRVEDYQDIYKKIHYFKAEFANRQITKLDISSLMGFSELVDIFTTVSQQWIMRAKLHAKLMMWLTEEELIEVGDMLLEDFLEKEKWNKEIAMKYNNELRDIFIATWGPDWWLWRSKETLEQLWEENPSLERVMRLAEIAFNEHVKEIFGVELPPLHFVAVNVEDPEELLKAEFWFAKFYSYILKNQLPS